MLSRLVTAVTAGIRGEVVHVEVDVAPGLPVCHIVGLPDAALSEARERVRSALRHAGFTYPLSRITVTLAPAERRKRGAAYDLAIALGILAASGQVRPRGDWAVLGELSLGGEVRTTGGALPLVATLATAGYRRILVPAADAWVGSFVPETEVIPVAHLDEAARRIAGRRPARATPTAPVTPQRVHGGAPATIAVGPPEPAGVEVADLAEVAGQTAARWALEVALAGGHHLLLAGVPGAGKTLLARTVPGLLPPLGPEEAREVALIRSAAGLAQQADHRRPFRAPHHTASYAALIGGGPALRPGLVTLAHAGVLFLDEAPEIARDVLEALRQPLEDGAVEVARAHGVVRFPARFQLIAAMNPCPCGWEGDRERRCSCPGDAPARYRRRIGGPLLDRIDIRVRMERVRPEVLVGVGGRESSATVAARISGARSRALARNAGRPNAALPGAALLDEIRNDPRSADLLGAAARQDASSARGIVRATRSTRTIADLSDAERIGPEAIAGALALRADPFGDAGRDA
ncbi:MAG: YifB family Mg chelatase-like AAA ATPase [Chloroflexota bacterium]